MRNDKVGRGRPERAAVTPPVARCLRENDAAAYVSLSPTAFRGEWTAGRAPPPFKLTEGRQGWVVEALDAYLDGLVRASPELVTWLRARGVPLTPFGPGRAAHDPAAASVADAVNEWDAACGITR